MITKPILELIYEAAHIQRWNDHIRPPHGFTELDKQAHKMFYVYVIAKFEESSGRRVNWVNVNLPSWGLVKGNDAAKLIDFAIENEIEARDFMKRHNM